MRGRHVPVARGAASLVEFRSPSEYFELSELVTRLGLRHFPPCRWLTRELDFADPVSPNHAARRDSYDDPLLAFQSPTGCYPLDLPRASRRTAPLLGFLPLQRIRGVESTSLLPTGPTRPATFRPQGFAPSRRLPPPPTFRTFRRGNARGVLPSGASPPGQAHQLVAGRFPLMAFFLRLGLSPPRKERTWGAEPDFLESRPYPTFYRLQGVAPSESPCRAGTRLSFPAGRSPLGLSLIKAYPPPKPWGFHPLRSCASPPRASTASLARPPRSAPRLHSSVSRFDDSARLSRG